MHVGDRGAGGGSLCSAGSHTLGRLLKQMPPVGKLSSWCQWAFGREDEPVSASGDPWAGRGGGEGRGRRRLSGACRTAATRSRFPVRTRGLRVGYLHVLALAALSTSVCLSAKCTVLLVVTFLRANTRLPCARLMAGGSPTLDVGRSLLKLVWLTPVVGAWLHEGCDRSGSESRVRRGWVWWWALCLVCGRCCLPCPVFHPQQAFGGRGPGS